MTSWLCRPYPWRHPMETFSALLAICAGNSLVTGEFTDRRPVSRSFDVFFDLRLNKRLSKQSRGWWFETPLRPWWRHSNLHMAISMAPSWKCLIITSIMMSWHNWTHLHIATLMTSWYWLPCLRIATIMALSRLCLSNTQGWGTRTLYLCYRYSSTEFLVLMPYYSWVPK